MLDFNNIIFEKYKCFENETIIKNIKPINIIIGKNNIGKSSLLDIIEIINDPKKLTANSNSIIGISKNITSSAISKAFGNYTEAQRWINQDIPIELFCDNNTYIKSRKHPNIYKINNFFNSYYDDKIQTLSESIGYSTKITKRIYAERNIVSETNSNSMEINGYGNGATQIISNFLNKALYTEDTVKIDLLKKLNEIMGEDANFTEILTQQINITGESEQWEIFLKENGKTRIALSQSGSGLKTILMVLIFTILVPKIENKNISDYIFLFEELENNLHPSLERRLLQYIEELSNRGAIFFLTTHSSTILNSFQNSENVQIYHIVKSENSTKVVSLDNILGKNACLNDLGIKASDILQANGIIWVEGPSDRIYINKWIDLWSNGKFREGIHYQCVFYGGRLLNNLSADEENINDLVNLINVNRNAVILIDSDKKSKAAPISSTKQRIQNEFQKNSQLCWITQGREIENYIPKSIIESFYNTNSNKDFKQYQKIDSFLENFSKNDSKNFSNSKIKFAKYFSNNMTLKKMKTSLDIDEQIIKIITEIEKWNLK